SSSRCRKGSPINPGSLATGEDLHSCPNHVGVVSVFGVHGITGASPKFGVHVGWRSGGGCGGRLRGAGGFETLLRGAGGLDATGSNVGTTGSNVDVPAHARRRGPIHPLHRIGVLVLEDLVPIRKRLS